MSLIVHFRRERTYVEVAAEAEQRTNAGEKFDPMSLDQWLEIGAFTMETPPSVGQALFFNSAPFEVSDVTWSFHVGAQRNEHRAMVTLIHRGNGVWKAPTEDFFKPVDHSIV